MLDNYELAKSLDTNIDATMQEMQTCFGDSGKEKFEKYVLAETLPNENEGDNGMTWLEVECQSRTRKA